MTVCVPKRINIGMWDDGQRDLVLSRFICWYYLISALNQTIKMVWGNFAAWNYLSKGILAVFLLFALLSMRSKNLIWAIVSELIVAGMFLLTYLNGNYNSSFESIVFNALLAYLPMGLCVISLKSVDVLRNALYRYSFPIQFLLLYTAFSFKSVQGDTYSMSIGYALLFQSLIVLDHFFEKKTPIDMVIFLIDFFAICLYGSRGPIVCLGTFFIIKLLISGDYSRKKRAVIIGGIIIVVLLWPWLLTRILQILPSNWLNSRTISLLLSGDFIRHDSGRMDIFADYIQLIKARPLLGYGLAGGWMYSSYPHNIVIELCLSFGIPIGLFATLYIIYIGIRSLKRGTESERALATVFFVTLVELFVSSSFIMSTHFFMMIAMGVRSGYMAKRSNCYERECFKEKE